MILMIGLVKKIRKKLLLTLVKQRQNSAYVYIAMVMKLNLRLM